MAKRGKFISEFFKDKNEVGALSPSSKFLRNKMLSHVDFKKAKTIVEFGPGNGIFTKGILKKLRKDGTLLVFETNEAFYNQIKEEVNDSRMILVNDSAEYVDKYLKENNLPKPDYIVSSLPFTVFPLRLKSNILTNANLALADHGKFIQFQYSLNAHKLLKRKFKNVKLDFTPANIPPAFIYECSKRK